MSARPARLFAALFCLVLLLAGCSAAAPKPPSPPAPAGGVTAVKLAVDADGLYEATAADLQSLGFDLAAALRDDISLWVGGSPAPFEWAGQGKDLAVRFNGLALGPDSYTRRNVYWLKRGAAATGAAAARGGPPTAHLRPDAGRGGRDHGDRPPGTGSPVRPSGGQARAGAGIWQTIFAPAKVEFQFDASGPAGRARASCWSTWSRSRLPRSIPTTACSVFLNDAFVADAPWDGAVPHLMTAANPGGTLKEKGNQLVIQAPGDTGAPADSVQLHAVEIAYPRATAAVEARTETRVHAGGRVQPAARLARRRRPRDCYGAPVPRRAQAAGRCAHEAGAAGGSARRGAGLRRVQLRPHRSCGHPGADAPCPGQSGRGPPHATCSSRAMQATIRRATRRAPRPTSSRRTTSTRPSRAGPVQTSGTRCPTTGKPPLPAFAVGRFPAQTPSRWPRWCRRRSTTRRRPATSGGGPRPCWWQITTSRALRKRQARSPAGLQVTARSR